MTDDKKTNVQDFIGEINGGVLEAQLAHTLSECALGTVLNGAGNKKGKVTLEFTINKFGDNDQVMITTKMSHATPTKSGKKSEDVTSDTAMFVGKGGRMTIDQPKEDMKGQFALKQAPAGISALKVAQ